MTAMRMQFFTIALLIFIGIWLTGFATAHWFLYVPVAALIFAGVTGICPGHLFWKKMGFEDTLPGPKVPAKHA